HLLPHNDESSCYHFLVLSMIESFYVFFLSFCAILSFQVHARLCQQSRVPRDTVAVSLDSSTPLYKCHPGRTALVQPAPGGGVYSGEEEKVTCSERHSRDRRPSWGWRPAR